MTKLNLIITALFVISFLGNIVQLQNRQALNNVSAGAYYNSGFRAGSMDALARLVECDGVKAAEVVRDYNIVSEELAKFGELDNSPMICE